MSRVKISEYRAKKILVGDAYKGIQLRSGSGMQIPKGEWVAKVDQGVKKRFKQGLVSVNKPADEMLVAIRSWEERGFSQFLLEPFLVHDASEEQYFALERVREGIRMLHTKDGGVDIEAHPEAVQTYVIKSDADITSIAAQSGLPETFLRTVVDSFNNNFLAFLEINPLVIKDGEVHLLDAAVLVDSAGSFFVHSWGEDDFIKAKAKHAAEERVEALAATTPASLKLSVIDPNGALFFLLSGGGGSIVIADEAELEGAGKRMANYGEYSGGPTREETYLYAKEIISLMQASKSQKKALVIAGGVANFTDVKKTFLGIIDALQESADALRSASVKVFVRRGGPNEAQGLTLMQAFLEKEQLLGSVHGSDAVITTAVEEAIAYINV
ncbi:MAG: hypothetical protein JWM46_214 [Candidatus Kaiserbacteria bacterium]|nr:hypothetical protein [Candidatus Kaiserbacteria bacterium]